MTLREALHRAVTHQDAKAAVRIAERCRLKGLTYNQVFALVQRHHPEIQLAEWDALLYEGETP